MLIHKNKGDEMTKMKQDVQIQDDNNKKLKFGIFSNIQEANERLDAIIEHSFDGIYITDGEANTIMVNRAYQNITGLTKADVIGKNMKYLVKENIISASGSLLAIRAHKPVTLEQKFKTGKRALITSSPIFDEKDNIIMVVTNVRDLTEIYNLKEEVELKKQQENKLRQELQHIQSKLHCKNMVAEDKNTLSVILWADKVAPLDATVMLLGETGVGKEVFAKYIYQNSQRTNESFIKVNCGAIPANLIESELFGYDKGAFTGANKNGKIGLFEVADKGTIFLDEIGELPLAMQVKLLRVLQEQEVERIGGTTPVKIDVRIIAATNRKLEEMVEAKTFREDLYYRLMVFPINIPPLRERRDDIMPLLQLFTRNLNKKYGFNKHFSDSAVHVLEDYSWPGNIRELKNIVERAIIISGEDEIGTECLPVYNKVPQKGHIPRVLSPVKDLKRAMEELELEYMAAAYEEYGNVRDAAKSLGMNASTFVRKRQKYKMYLENDNN